MLNSDISWASIDVGIRSKQKVGKLTTVGTHLVGPKSPQRSTQYSNAFQMHAPRRLEQSMADKHVNLFLKWTHFRPMTGDGSSGVKNRFPSDSLLASNGGCQRYMHG